MRTAIRGAWLRSLPPSLAAKFVLRGRDLGNAPVLNAEAANFGDMLFLNSSSTLGRTAGPLMSLVSWFDCSLRAFPRVAFVGKCDDDMWMHARGVEQLKNDGVRWW